MEGREQFTRRLLRIRDIEEKAISELEKAIDKEG
jgi:hypothetical protein